MPEVLQPCWTSFNSWTVPDPLYLHFTHAVPSAWNIPLSPLSFFGSSLVSLPQRCLNGLDALAMSSPNMLLLPEHTLSLFTIFDHLKSVDPHRWDTGSLAVVSWDYHGACHTGSSIWNKPSGKRGFQRGTNTIPWPRALQICWQEGLQFWGSSLFGAPGVFPL